MTRRKLSILMGALFLLVAATSCTKEAIETPAKTPEEYLTSKPWKLESLRSLIANTPYYYERGSSSNNQTFIYDNEFIQFKADHTGTYTEQNGATTPLTWNFIDPNKTKLRYVIQFAPALTVNWEIAVLDDFSIKYGEYYSKNGSNAESYAVRTPKASN